MGGGREPFCFLLLLTELFIEKRVTYYYQKTKKGEKVETGGRGGGRGGAKGKACGGGSARGRE